MSRTTTKKKKTLPEVKELTLEYHLDELPTSQHRAGLAGLVLMNRWRARQAEQRGLVDIEITGTRSACLRIDLEGMRQLFDLAYASATDPRPYPKPFKNKAPIREEVREVKSEKTGKVSQKTVYIYPVVVPQGAYVEDWDQSRDQPNGGKWIKLWRDMIWSILRGVPATRKPFEARTPEGKGDKLADQTFRDLTKPDTVVPLPSTYFLGAQATTAENVQFRDFARNQFLLHFWPFVAPIYVPQTVDIDNKRRFHGYVITVPDVNVLEDFCDELDHVMRQRTADLAGYLPKQAVVDLPAAGALDLMSRLSEVVRKKRDFDRELVCGVDIFHVSKEGNNVRVLASRRVDVEPVMVDHYTTICSRYREHRFRRQRLQNLLDRMPWYVGFDRILCTISTKWTIASTWFCGDVRTAFKSETNMSNSNGEETTLESLIYSIVGRYIRRKLEAKHDNLKWETVNSLPEGPNKKKQLDDFYKKRRDIAKNAFLAIRSRTGSDFVDYFSGTLCSVSQSHLDEASFIQISSSLLKETSKVRTLTLLALSARA